MNGEPLKHEIRRRLFAARRAAGKEEGSLADGFTTCPTCSGRGTICREWTENGVSVASLDACPLCNGDGFVEKEAK
jgi:DnaJ-class molecular chaperone